MSLIQFARPFVLLLLIATSTMAGCRSESAEHPTGDDPENLVPEDSNTVAAEPGATAGGIAAGPDTLAAEKQGVLSIEGMQEPVTLKLFRTPGTFAMPFYTYYPEDIAANIIPSDISATARFTANIGGRLTNDAYVELFYYPGVLTEEDLLVFVREKAGELGQVSEGERRYPWALAEYPFQGPRLVGRYVAARRNGRYFHILLASPPEMAEGMAARADVILSEWRWGDTGAPLGH